MNTTDTFATTAFACRCSDCAGPACNCGCQAAPAQEDCNCGCAAGRSCRCSEAAA